MKLMEALAELKAGKLVVRNGWKDDEGYLQIIHDVDHIWKILPKNKPHPNAGNYVFCIEDLLADDWVNYPKEVKEECGNIEL